MCKNIFRAVLIWFLTVKGSKFFFSEMQAKIIDFASDKIAKSLQKIEKEDVMNAYSKVSSKIRRNKYLVKKDEKVTISEENSEMLEKIEIDINPCKFEKLDKQPNTVMKNEKDDDLNIDGNGKSFPFKDRQHV